MLQQAIALQNVFVSYIKCARNPHACAAHHLGNVSVGIREDYNATNLRGQMRRSRVK